MPGMPGGPGAPGQLHFDDGRPPLAVLPEIADEHRDRLGLNAMANGVAGPGSGTPDPGPVASPDQVAAAVKQNPGQAVNPIVMGSAVTADPQVTGLSPDADAANQKAINDIALSGHVPGKATPATPAHWSPDSKKVVTERGPAYDPAAADMRIQAGNDVMNAQLGENTVAKQNADEAAARAEAAHAAAIASAAKLQAENVRKEKEYHAQEAAKQADLDTYTKNNAPDPNHYFKEKGTFVNILSAIAQGLGAAGASLGHTQNFAYEITQNAIQRDMAAQEKAYNEGIAGRNTALARFVKIYNGDMEQAKLALSQTMNRIAETDTQRFSSQAQSKQIAAAGTTLAAQFKQKQLLDEQQKQELAAGKTTETSEDKYHQASGGSAGGRDLTLAERLDLDKRQKAGKGEKDQGALGLPASSVAKAETVFAKKKDDLSRYHSALASEGALYGLHLDPETGQWINKDKKVAQPGDIHGSGIGYIKNHIPNGLVSPDAVALRSARKNSVRLHAQSIYGTLVHDEDAAKEANNTLGNTPEEILESLQRRAEEYKQAVVAADSGAALVDPRIVNKYYDAKKAVNYSRAYKTPLAGPMPMLGNPSGPSGDDAGDGSGGDSP